VGVAYVVVPFFATEGGKRNAMLFVYDGGRWKFVARSFDASYRFSCGTNVLVDPSYRIDQQIRVLKRVASCRSNRGTSGGSDSPFPAPPQIGVCAATGSVLRRTNVMDMESCRLYLKLRYNTIFE
jgi:hypothetical protein